MEMEAELNNWISQYIANQENPSPEVRAVAPLRMAEITVEDVEGEPGLVSGFDVGGPAFQVHGSRLHSVPTRQLDKQ